MFLAQILERDLSNNWAGLLPYLRANGCGSMDDAAVHCAEYMRAAGADIDTAIDTLGIAYMIHRWRDHRMIYRIDEALTEELLNQSRRIEEDEALPCELLTNLPFPCFSVETAAFGVTVRDHKNSEIVRTLDFSGRFILTTSEAGEFGNGWKALSSMWESTDGKLHHYYFPIINNGTLKDSIDALHAYLNQNYDTVVTRDDAVIESIPSMLAAQIVLYLQATNADVQSRPAAKRDKKRVKSRNTSQKPPKVADVGYRVGATMRKAKVQTFERATPIGTGSVKRPHVRRGHWHCFWTGSKSDPDKRKKVLQWVAPTMIHGGNSDDLPTVIPVKGEKK